MMRKSGPNSAIRIQSQLTLIPVLVASLTASSRVSHSGSPKLSVNAESTILPLTCTPKSTLSTSPCLRSAGCHTITSAGADGYKRPIVEAYTAYLLRLAYNAQRLRLRSDPLGTQFRYPSHLLRQVLWCHLLSSLLSRSCSCLA
jgi:hypothetical protein